MIVSFREKKNCKARRSENFEFDLFDFETVSYLGKQNGTKTRIVYFMNSCFIDQSFKHYSYAFKKCFARIQYITQMK